MDPPSLRLRPSCAPPGSVSVKRHRVKVRPAGTADTSRGPRGAPGAWDIEVPGVASSGGGGAPGAQSQLHLRGTKDPSLVPAGSSLELGARRPLSGFRRESWAQEGCPAAFCLVPSLPPPKLGKTEVQRADGEGEHACGGPQGPRLRPGARGARVGGRVRGRGPRRAARAGIRAAGGRGPGTRRRKATEAGPGRDRGRRGAAWGPG